MARRREPLGGSIEWFRPDDVILPVVIIDRVSGMLRRLVGTCFFYDARGGVLSVDHVLGIHPEPDEELVAYVPPVVPGARLVPKVIRDIRPSRNHDLAVGRLALDHPSRHLTLPARDPAGIPWLLTWDYSSSLRSIDLGDGRPQTTFVGYAWRGTWLATYVAKEPGMRSAAKIIDVPFPVMQGASGAPLVVEGETNVVGILFGNVARQLMPPPQLTVEGQPWYLPIGQAIHCQHIREFLSEE